MNTSRQTILANRLVSRGTIVSFITLCFAMVTGEVRCFCNQPDCVSTGYMCKSSIGLCYLQTTPDGAHATRTVHACAETLPAPQRIACADGRDDVTVTSQKRPTTADGEDARSTLFCCGTDMCNYKPRLLINIYIPRANDSTAKDLLSKRGNEVSAVPGSGHVQLWFRVAVICVPVMGAILLVFIILAAVRMLRNDRLRHSPERFRHCSTRRPLANDECKQWTLVAEPPQLSPCCVLQVSSLAKDAQRQQPQGRKGKTIYKHPESSTTEGLDVHRKLLPGCRCHDIAHVIRIHDVTAFEEQTRRDAFCANCTSNDHFITNCSRT